MAYFIVIGTNDKVNGVVDEIAKSHQLHNTISSGCIITKQDGGLTYKWNPLGDGVKGNNDDGACSLKDMLTNHLANFKTVLPDHEVPKVMLVSNCMDDEDEERLKWILDELHKTEGAAFANPQIDIALIAYNLSNPSDVAQRPHWRILKKVKELLNRIDSNAKLFYINNMDYMGAATNLSEKLIGKFLGHWEMMADCGCKNTISSPVYAIGIAEYQYNFEDLKEYFELDVERVLLERTLNAHPSSDTQALLDKKRCFDIDLKFPWLDGLKEIKNTWSTYCDTTYDYSITPGNHVYCVEKQKKHIVSYLNGFLKIYINKCNKDLNECEEELSAEESVLQNLNGRASEQQNQTNQLEQESTEEIQTEQGDVQSEIREQQDKIERIKTRINYLRNEIDKNTFKDADEIASQFDPEALVTDEERDNYEAVLKRYEQLENYVQSDECAKLVNQTILESIGEREIVCPKFPKQVVDSIGRLEEIASDSKPVEEVPETEELHSRMGCAPWAWLSRLFSKPTEEQQEESQEEPLVLISEETAQEAGKAIIALKTTIPSVIDWWHTLLSTISSKEQRLEECVNRIKSYGETIPSHRKSRSLIDIMLVDSYRQKDEDYNELVLHTLNIWFNPNLENRPSQINIIDKEVVDKLRKKYSVLKWDNSNPFVKECLSDDDIHQIVEHTSKESKPFVQYENVDKTIKSKIADYFFFNNSNIEKSPTQFREKYTISSKTLCPEFLEGLDNSLCTVQILEIKNPVSDVHDFTPKRESSISPKPIDPNFDSECATIIGEAQTSKDIARRIYDWLCSNIQYDATKSIHDADTCWKTKRGVCQAYCDLFCHIAGKRLNTEVVEGKCKMPDGNISDTLHAWLYVYTDGYNGIFIDPTWGAGHVEEGHFVQNVDRDIWFDVDPAWMIFTHYPESENMKKLNVKVSEEQFKELPLRYPNPKEEAFDELSRCLSDL